MRKRETTKNTGEKLLLSVEDLMHALSLGRNAATAFGYEAGASVKIGRRVLFHKKRLLEYIDSLMEGGSS